VRVELERLTTPYVDRLEHAVAPLHAEVVGAQDGVSAGTTPTPGSTSTRTMAGSLAVRTIEACPPLAEALRSRGLRLTAQRQLVLEAVYALGHATPDQVHSAVCGRRPGSTSRPSTARSNYWRSWAW
jgi:hypothetical protein